MKHKDQILLERAYELVYESVEHASYGVMFRKDDRGIEDTGCCIGVKHKCRRITLSKVVVERINKIRDLKFWPEGIAGKDPDAEPGMVLAMKDYFPSYSLQRQSWDDITEEHERGTANSSHNIVYTFMQHRVNKIIERYTYTTGTMLDALSRPKPHFPKNSPHTIEDRMMWLTKHMKKAGFYEKLSKPFKKYEFLRILDEMEHTVYPDQQTPDSTTYFGKHMEIIEKERNKTIHDLMTDGGCCFAGSGHLVELSKQFSNLEFLDKEKAGI